MSSGGLSLRDLYEARRYEEAWAEYARVLIEEPVTAEDHLTGGLVARLRGDLQDARLAFERCLAEEPAGITLGKALMTYGVVLREIGEPCTAVQYLQQFLDRMDEYEELRPVAWGAGHHNLGMALRGARRYEEAIVAYEVAIREFRREGMNSYLREALWSQAWVYCIMGNCQSAILDLNEAEPFCRDDRGQSQLILGWAFADAVAGRRPEALQRCETLLSYLENVPTDVLSHACWVAGRVMLDMGQLEGAEEMQRGALDWALKTTSDSRCLQDANDLKRSILEVRLHKESSEGA